MEKFQKWMDGRYGSDQLTLALLIISVIVSFVTAFIRIPYIQALAYIPLILAIWRTFSKNRAKRYEENRKFMNFWNPIYLKAQKYEARLKDMKTHKYYKCPNCHKTLRVPRGKGKIRITCPVCKHEFSKKS